MNNFAKFLMAFVAVVISLFLIILPGLLFLLAWNALRSIGVSVGWIFFIIVVIVILLAWLAYANYKQVERVWQQNSE